MNGKDNKDSIEKQIELATQRIQDLTRMQVRGGLDNDHYFLADAEKRACEKKIFRLRLSLAMERWSA